MTNYPRSAYGSTNPNAGKPANGDVAAWGGHQWPAGVPVSLLGTATYVNRTTNGQTLKVVVRKELVPLWQLTFQLIDTKYHYPVYSRGPSDGKPWGPWGYENRPIAGTQRASGHSAALAVDINAPFNPYSFTWQCDMPPAMVADLESLGYYWGGRYVNQRYDPEHFGYCFTPGAVALHIARAKKLLGVATIPPPVTPKPPVKPPYTPPPSTTWPLPAGHYFGLKSGPPQSHGGARPADVPWVKWIQTRVNEMKYAGLRVDGDFGPATKAGVTTWQRARHQSTTSRYGEVWADDFINLMKDR
jgi:hypothetical protein